MTRLLLAGIGLVFAVGLAPGQDSKSDERPKVEVLLATEHVPKDLKAGTRVDLKMVTGKTVGPNGLTLYNTSMVARDVEIASIAKVEKPANPESAVRVHLLVAKDMVARIEKVRDQKAAIAERQADGSILTVMKPIALRLEVPKAEKK